MVDFERYQPIFLKNLHLLGGFNSSEKYEFVSWDYDIPNIWKVIKFHGSKPPISHDLHGYVAADLLPIYPSDLQAVDGRDGASGRGQELVVVALVALRIDLP
jgi:hypothetical protein